jgi:hypothetical protein
MAGLDPQTLSSLSRTLQEGKGGGGQGYGQADAGGADPGADYSAPDGGGADDGDDTTTGRYAGLDPLSEYNAAQRDLGTLSHFADMRGGGMGPSTSLGVALQGNRRAARAEAYTRKLQELELMTKLLGSAGGSNLLAASMGPGGYGPGWKHGETLTQQQGNPTSYTPSPTTSGATPSPSAPTTQATNPNTQSDRSF